MTYNFDPERWYAREMTALEAQMQSGALSAKEFASAKQDIIRRYDDMVKRLDGTYRIPSFSP